MKRLLKRLLKPIILEVIVEDVEVVWEAHKRIMPTYMTDSFLNANQEEIRRQLTPPFPDPHVPSRKEFLETTRAALARDRESLRSEILEELRGASSQSAPPGEDSDSRARTESPEQDAPAP